MGANRPSLQGEFEVIPNKPIAGLFDYYYSPKKCFA